MVATALKAAFHRKDKSSELQLTMLNANRMEWIKNKNTINERPVGGNVLTDQISE